MGSIPTARIGRRSASDGRRASVPRPGGHDGAMPTFHFGRLIDHVHLLARPAASRASTTPPSTRSAGAWDAGRRLLLVDELFVLRRRPAHGDRHLAFPGRRPRAMVDRFHEAALAAGGERQRRTGRAALPPRLLRRLRARPRRQQHRGRVPWRGRALARRRSRSRSGRPSRAEASARARRRPPWACPSTTAPSRLGSSKHDSARLGSSKHDSASLGSSEHDSARLGSRKHRRLPEAGPPSHEDVSVAS